MLDVNKCPGKPQYGMAAGQLLSLSFSSCLIDSLLDFPLVLHDCQFEDIKWQSPDGKQLLYSF